MAFRIVIAGETQCELLEQACIIADYLSQSLPSFFYKRIEKPVFTWKGWLKQLNMKNKWHHTESPLIWKELLLDGSKACYIGGVTEFLEYCHTYYNFDSFINTNKLENLCKNSNQLKNNISKNDEIIQSIGKYIRGGYGDDDSKNNYAICISGANNPLTSFLLFKLLELKSSGEPIKRISKIYLYDSSGNDDIIQSLIQDCQFIDTSYKHAVTHISRLGMGLTKSDLLIVLEHVPLNNEIPIGEWLFENKNVMMNLAEYINACAAPTLKILFPNFGPACYNATILIGLLRNINRGNIVVATSDLGLDIIEQLSEATNMAVKDIYCPPVWGFVGINHIVDIRTTIHRYNAFYPNERYAKVENTTLNIGSFEPELRMMEYLVYNNETIWLNFANRKMNNINNRKCLNKIVSLVNTIKKWLFGPEPNEVLNLGVFCNGTFGLNFKGVFSQPVIFEKGLWKPARGYVVPKDPQVKINYLEYIAELMLNLGKTELPKVIPITPLYTTKKVVIAPSKKYNIIRFVE